MRTYRSARFALLSLVLALAGSQSAISAEETTPAPAETANESPQSQPFSRAGADTCLGCHDDEVTLAIFKNPHGARTSGKTPFGHDQLQCEACHGPGGGHARKPAKGKERLPVVRFGHDAPTPIDIQNGMCSGCHEADLDAGWHGGAHANNDVGCADCHKSHTARDPVLAAATQSETCGSCHTIIRLEQHRAFAHPLDDGKMTCSSCHNAHGAATDASLVRTNTNDTCYGCHAEKRGPFLWEHAPVAEDCTTCHAPHGSSHPGMLVQRGPMLCQNCHSEAGHPSLAPAPGESLPGGPRSQYVLGMNCLNCHSSVHGSNHPSGSKLMR